LENPVIENSGLLEQKALNVLHEYEGANNYIIISQKKYQTKNYIQHHQNKFGLKNY